MKNNLPNVNDTATDKDGAVWAIKEVKAHGIHSAQKMIQAASGMTLGSRTISCNYYADILIESGDTSVWVDLTSWRNLCQFGQFEKPSYKTSRCKGYELPSYQSALMGANEQGLYGTEAKEIAAKVSGIDPTAIYIGPARVDGRCVEGHYSKV